MSAVFHTRALSLPGRSMPPSIPLIIRRDLEWVSEQSTLCEYESDEEGSQQSLGAGGHLKVVQEAIDLLSTIEKPVSILSVCGPFRTGKSYLLSRILGNHNAFKVGHTMKTCTKCVWMATTVLECEEFVVVLLDTEGMDAIDEEGSDESDYVKKQLMVAVLMSSLLIYNSLTVPEWNDLEDLSCFSQLSSLINIKSTQDYDDISTNFPDFLWLIRDAFLQLLDKTGNPISPVDYLMKYVLVRSESTRPTNEDYVVSAVRKLFPSIDCRMLPRPSADVDIIMSMDREDTKLDHKFENELQSLIEYILQRVKIKDISGNPSTNGAIIAESFIYFVDCVNSDDSLTLDSTYITAAEAVLSKISCNLVNDYKREMTKALEGLLPMEEFEAETSSASCRETLWSVHERIMTPKMAKLEFEIDHLLSVHSNNEESTMLQKKNMLLSNFSDSICKISKDETKERIVGGVFYRFVMENMHESQHFCQELVLKHFRKISQTIEVATIKHSTIELSHEFLAAERDYYSEAIGPAKDEVYINRRLELQNGLEQLSFIPGRPIGLHITGMAKNRIKLQWNGTDTNAEEVEYYEVRYMCDKVDWKEIDEKFYNQFAVIDNLSSNTLYMFQVRARNKSQITGNWSATIVCSTTLGSVAKSAAVVGSFMGGMLASPAIAVVTMPLGGPLSLAAGVVSAPVTGALMARAVAKHYGAKGELKNSSEAEVDNDCEEGIEIESSISNYLVTPEENSSNFTSSQNISIIHENDD